MNSARSVLLATIPPTFAAARNTACGRCLANQSNTAAWSRRSTSARLTVCSWTPSDASRRASAEPTIPRCPATKTFFPFRSNGVLAIGNLTPGDLEIAGHHLPDKFGKTRLRLPAEFLVCLAGVADQKVNLGRTKVNGIDANDGLAGFLVDAGFLDALAAPFDRPADLGERQFDEFAHRTRLACGQHEIVGRVGLQDPVHAFDIVPGVAPVALGIEIAEIEHLLEAGLDARHGAGDLAGDEGFAADRALVVEKNTVGGKHSVGLAVVHRDPVAVEFGDAIRRARIKGRGFLLRHLLHEPV